MAWWQIPASLAIALAAFGPKASATPVGAQAVIAQPAAASTVSVATAQAVSPGGAMEARIEQIRGSLDGTHVADFPAGAYAGKNLIIIQVESLNDFLIGRKYRGREVTPNINRLVNQSWYWPNAYSETGMGNTSDAEFIVNTSLFAPSDQACAVKYTNRRPPALPRLLGKAGYFTFTIHPNTASYWNRGQLYKALGFTKAYDRHYFKGDPWLGQFGPSDQALFKRGTTAIKGAHAMNRPFYAQFITLSSHPPFLWIPESRRPMRTPGALSGSLVGKYMSAESYTDAQLGGFIKTLKKSGRWDDSIIVIYGDHTAMNGNYLSGKNAAGARALLGRSYRPIDRQRVGLIVHLPGQTAPVLRTDVAGQVDIMPTVADLLGVDLSGVPHMGRSLFVDSGALVPLNAYLRKGSFLNDRVLVLPKRGSASALAYRLPDGAGTGLTGVDTADVARVNALKRLSDKWLMSLKKYNNGVKGWIPDAAARVAAAKYGFRQK